MEGQPYDVGIRLSQALGTSCARDMALPGRQVQLEQREDPLCLSFPRVRAERQCGIVTAKQAGLWHGAAEGR